MKYEYPSGSFYEGELVDGMFKETGKFCYNNGDIYEGEFNEDKFEGYGVFYFKSGCIYRGFFSNDMFHGIGTFVFQDGSIEKGKFYNDKRVGKFFQMDTKVNSYFEIIYQNDIAIKTTCIEEACIPKEKNPLHDTFAIKS
tara:strand:+ start:1285 stop:1704 length:420 start_codon:yes stop_codon:yes gene_type:complete